MYPTDTTTSGHRSDLYVIFDTQPSGALPALADIFVATVCQSFVKYDLRHRFVPVVHRYYITGPVNDTAQQSYCWQTHHAVEIYKRLGGYETMYKGTTAAIADISRGAWYLVCIGGNATHFSTLYASIRMRFSE